MSDLQSSTQFRVAKTDEARDALSLVLGGVAPSARGAIIDSLSRDKKHCLGPLDALAVGVCDEKVVAAVWAQPQSGNAATFWPPDSLPGQYSDHAWMLPLLEVCIKQVDAAGVATSQILFDSDDAQSIGAFEEVGFLRIAELNYLACVVKNHDSAKVESDHDNLTLSFETYEDSKYGRLVRIVEATYEQTLDCPALTGQRNIDDTLKGYKSTGNFCPENWFFVQHQGEDIGVLLLAEHELAENYELVYMGLISKARGKGFAQSIIEHAKQTAHSAGADQLMVAVDVTNTPAKIAYERSGMLPWAKRWAYVRSR